MTEVTANCLLGPLPPRWLGMWLLAGALFLAGKAVVVWPMRHRFGLTGTLSFAFLWVGMDAKAFAQPSIKEKGQLAPSKKLSEGAGSLLSLALTAVRTLLGVFLLWFAAHHFTHPLAQGWCGMIGLILLLHFGLFDGLAALWNSLGFPVTPIMNRPATATSLTEFWGRRWNMAFRDLAHPFVFRPVARRWGMGVALWTSFAVSGLAHELVISLPAGGGYGLPTAYFLLQALGITLERRVFKNVRATARLPRWLFTHAFTVLPAFFLFHPPFVERVMIPFFHAIGALS